MSNCLVKYSALFVEGTTTNVKAGAKLAYLSFAFTLISALGMVISQLLENGYHSCKIEEFQKYVTTCLKEYLTNLSTWSSGRTFLRLFDAFASLFLIPIGNALENIFRGSTMARVLSGTLRLACIMVVFEICYASGLSMQISDFYTKWASEKYLPQIVATNFMMDEASDFIWTLDNLLYTYFLLILSFLASDCEKFSPAYYKTAFVGGILGLLSLLGNVLSVGGLGFFSLIELIGYLGLQLLLLVIIFMTGRALAGMEGDLIGKRGKKGKGKKGKKAKKGEKV